MSPSIRYYCRELRPRWRNKREKPIRKSVNAFHCRRNWTEWMRTSLDPWFHDFSQTDDFHYSKIIKRLNRSSGYCVFISAKQTFSLCAHLSFERASRKLKWLIRTETAESRRPRRPNAGEKTGRKKGRERRTFEIPARRRRWLIATSRAC